MKIEVEVTGIVTDVLRFRGSQDGVGVITLHNGKAQHKVIGVAEGVNVGDSIEVSGHEIEHPHYGKQVRAVRITITLPRTRDVLSDWLVRHFNMDWSASKKLVEEWFDEYTTLGASLPAVTTIIDTGDPIVVRFWNCIIAEGGAIKALFDRHGAGLQFNALRVYLVRKAVTDKLVRMGLDTKEAFALYQARGSEAAEQLKADPYVVYYYIEGVSFSKIDRVYLDQPGNKKNDLRRVRATCLHEMRSCTEEGHTAMYYDDFVDLLEEMHPEFSAQRLVGTIQELIPEFLVLYGDPTMVQLTPYSRYEAGIAEFVSFGKIHTLPEHMERD